MTRHSYRVTRRVAPASSDSSVHHASPSSVSSLSAAPALKALSRALTVRPLARWRNGSSEGHHGNLLATLSYLIYFEHINVTKKNSLSGAHEAMTLFAPRSSLAHARSGATQCTRSAKGEERAVASRRLTHRRIPRARRAQLNGASARERPSDRSPLSIQSSRHCYKHDQRKRSIFITNYLWLHF